MNKLWNQLIWQMADDTLRVTMLLYGLCIVFIVYTAIEKVIKFLCSMIGRGCKAIWRFTKRARGRQVVTVVTEESNMEEA